jgi:hypothetical protein
MSCSVAGPELHKATAFGTSHLINKSWTCPANTEPALELNVSAKIGNWFRRRHLFYKLGRHFH